MLTPGRVLVEVAVDSVASATAAAGLGAGRIELCQALEVGGLTPSCGLLAAVRARVDVPVFVMIRSAPGGFGATPADLAAMLDDVAAAKDRGADGIVAGVLDAQLAVDPGAMARLVAAAAPLPVTFHRAFDLVADQPAALLTLGQLGVRRVLTSGGAPRAREGLPVLRTLAALAPPPLTLLPGGGITGRDVADLVRLDGIDEVHVSGVRFAADPAADRFGFGRSGHPDAERVAAVIAAARAAPPA